MKISEILKKGIEELNKNNIEEPINKSRILLSSILNIPKEKIVLKYEDELNENMINSFFDGIQQISNYTPIQYVIRKARIYETKLFS